MMTFVSLFQQGAVTNKANLDKSVQSTGRMPHHKHSPS